VNIAIVGAGWAGLAAALTATQAGHQVTLYEAARDAGGRARGVPAVLPNGQTLSLDNGQHILIGAYTETLRLLRLVGHPAGVPSGEPVNVPVNAPIEVSMDGTQASLLRLPLTLIGPDGVGLRLPARPAWLPAPWRVLAGVLRHRAWPWRERIGLLRAAQRWQRAGFLCAPDLSVAGLCALSKGAIGPRVWAELIEPLCVSALNTPATDASAQVFLRVLRDALFAAPDGADLLLPRVDLGTLFPSAALQWLRARGAQVHLGRRVHDLQALHGPGPGGHAPSNRDGVSQDRAPVDGQDDRRPHDATILACPAPEAARLVQTLNPSWAAQAQALPHTAIATVYAWSPDARLRAPMLALPSSAQAPAQFVFDRGLLDASGHSQGLLAFVVSASSGTRADIEARVLRQAQTQLGLQLQPVQTIIEKRATFACTPGLTRPPAPIGPALYACGDYVAGPYPATLEGAIRSGMAAVQAAISGRPAAQ
jgi:squalene-associated FAD-dependent desaturase